MSRRRAVPLAAPLAVPLAGLIATLALGGALRADSSQALHEYLEPDASEAAALGATTPSGALPAAIETPSGAVTPPDVHTTPPPARVYEPGPASDTSGFRPDRDTKRPEIERYDDPFTPTLTPYKRMFAFDAVRADYSLYVRATSLRAVATSAGARDTDDRFFGDMSILLRQGEDVRIPTVGPGARIVGLVTSPATDVTVLADGADNWFLRANASGRVRLVAEVAIDRSAFASDFPDVSWRELAPVALQPTEHDAPYREVARAIGLTAANRPKEVVTKLVEYFRSFAPSSEPPNEHDDVYLDLALSKKGVCRHRSFAFLVTALHAGIATRLVHNEAHAWVEVFDGSRWHRIDLGGAAVDLADDPRNERPPHRPPPDRFGWPTGRDSGSDLAHRERQEQAATREKERSTNAPGEPDVSSPGPSTAAPFGPSGDGASGDPPPADPGTPPRPISNVAVEAIDRELFKGKPLRLRGRVEADGAACASARVDVLLEADGVERRIGSLATDERGIFDGEVVVPRDVPVGDHRLFVGTPGNRSCGAGRSR